MPDKKVPPPNESVTYKSESPHAGSPPDLRLLHYNDVYHVDASSNEPVGGVARFVNLINHYRDDAKYEGQPELLTFFSGDAFNPSLESSVTKGDHMVPLLNKIGTDVAALGNHDLDFGVPKFMQLSSKCTFPWLIANVLDPALGEDVPIGNCKKTLMLTSSNGIKIGLIGLGEREWLGTINSLPPNLIYKSASETAKELVPGLRAQGAEIVVAITHMREPNDNKLAEQTDGLIDIILGGHDHYYNHSIIKGTHVLRSGSDFKQLSYIEARRKGDGSGRWDFDITRRDITSEIAEDKPTVELVGKLTATLKTTIQRPIGYSAAPLDARFRTVRLEESNLGNFVCDIMRFYYSGDCSLMASGTIRGDQVYPPGPILLKDILSCFPFEDPVVVIKVTGQAIWDALENSVSLYPALEGRFPQVSNIKFEFDDRKPSGSRILSAGIGGEPIDMERKYVLVTRGYMARGKDGYTSLLVEAEGGKAEEIVSEENGILIQMMLRQYFMSLKVVGHWKYWSEGMSAHWSSVTDKVSAKHPLLNCTCAKSKTEPEPETSSSAPPQQQKEQEQQSHKTGWDQWTPESIRQRRCAALHDDEDDETSTKDEEEEAKARAIEEMDREMKLMRRAFRRWARRARVVCKVVDELQADDVECDWTRPIAPRVEGRIIRVGAD